ncbi:hypothetical protein [Gloeocapsopsis sp. IPPAS B-1203]|uniref:hypothetical protein n=1 Tax=Gloeocapsopsis sp. IPPAS B-1203 TaxID=2049454 RepID=UPI000C1950A4|nr:hypothetical protein [Gloeocapsopsis sp. IPPAS B-1203]PIG90929.1 hypothetical protein CSQ79_24155 [Gloeocapsopsis sp. IPPAS B-1203]
MANQFHYIIPLPPPETQDIFAAYQATRQFYREVQSRTDLQQHCDWYYTIAERHRQELEQMRNELNILSWFRRARS